MINAIEIRKVLGSVFLTLAWVFSFLFVKASLVIDWFDNGSFTTNLKFLVILLGLLISSSITSFIALAPRRQN